MTIYTRIPAATVGLMVLLLACAGGPRPVTAPGTASDSIPEREIQKEMASVRGVGDFYPVMLLLVGGATGAAAGCLFGAQLDTGGGEDPGLGGCVVGGGVGLVAGAIGGVVWGTSLANRSRRAEAIRRIRARRAGAHG